MLITLTIKLTPESEKEAIEYAKILAALRAQVDALIAAGALPPAEVRWLLNTPRFGK